MDRFFFNFCGFILCIICSFNVNAGSRFSATHPCSDSGRYCISSGARVIDGIKVSRDCWEYTYTKKCNYPSKDDCSKYGHCYDLGEKSCILKDRLGYCVNQKKEFSCKRWVPTYSESEKIRYGLEEKDGQEGLLCKGIPCMDGHCIDKSYEMDEDMVSSISQLGALSKGARDGLNIKLFEGIQRHCTKKACEYTSCCRVENNGWGQSLGGKCTSEENLLNDLRRKNLCEYVGKEKKESVGIPTLVKHHYCCFENILQKVVQREGRKQLYPASIGSKTLFGTGENPDCRGLNLEEIKKIKWNKIDWEEVAIEMRKKVMMPDAHDIETRINNSYESNTKKFDYTRKADARNKTAGMNKKIIGE